jgi:hypothetical protein
LFEDTVAPLILHKTPLEPGGAVAGNHLLFSVSDKGSGIDSDKNIVTKIDGAWRLNEYDFEQDISAVPLDDISAGKHTLQITVTDNLGNESKLDLPFIRR